MSCLRTGRHVQMMPRFASIRVQIPRGMKFQVWSAWLRTLFATAVTRRMEVIVTLVGEWVSRSCGTVYRTLTYNPPSMNTPRSISFSCFLRCSLNTSRTGSARTITSVAMLMTALATQNFVLSMHVPGIFLFHERWVGMHWRIVANVVAIPELMMIASAPQHSNWKGLEMKMRLYSKTTDVLFRQTTIL